MPEQEIVAALTNRFALPADTCRVQRPRRVFAEVPRESIPEVVSFIRDTLHFGSLCAITGMETGDNYELIYHLASDQGVVLNVKTSAPKTDPVFDTVTDLFPGAALYEIEACNLLGLHIKEVPPDIRYPLPDSWPNGQYPLRKDWSPESENTPQEGEC